jgi:hypothetical protein
MVKLTLLATLELTLEALYKVVWITCIKQVWHLECSWPSAALRMQSLILVSSAVLLHIAAVQ